MTALGYRPHRAARALRTGRTQAIGLVASTLATFGNSRMLEAVTDAAAERSYALVVVTLGTAGDISGAFARLRDQGVDGVIVLNEATELARDATLPVGLDLVVVDSPADDRFAIVQTDHAGGARSATAHLLALGHRTVHHVAGPDGSFAAGERERGWRAALQASGIEPPALLRGDWTAASGHDLAGAIPDDATAVFAANDQLALGLLRGLADAGRAVPGAVSVVGFDDVVDAAEFRPPLTTVRQDFAALGESAVAALIAGIEDAAPRSVTTIPTTLVVRGSAASPIGRSSAPSPRTSLRDQSQPDR